MVSLWRVSHFGIPLAAESKAADWFHPAGPLLTCEASAIAALYAQLVAVEQPNPRAMALTERIFELQIPDQLVIESGITWRMARNSLPVRQIVGKWIETRSSLAMRVPSLSGAYQYIVNLRHPLATSLAIEDRGAYPYTVYLPQVECALTDPDAWLCVRGS